MKILNENFKNWTLLMNAIEPLKNKSENLKIEIETSDSKINEMYIILYDEHNVASFGKQRNDNQNLSLNVYIISRVSYL